VRPVGGVLTAGVGSAGMPGLFGLPLARLGQETVR